MNRIVDKAISEIANLPEEDQEKIGRGLLSHIEKLRRLRTEIDKGIKSLDADGGKELDIESFILRMRKNHGAA
jgi:hypothetical protein